tara:strand:- start:2816 stop:3193 length:378 start_codon:yes stop_codon:yes gene_type:complete
MGYRSQVLYKVAKESQPFLLMYQLQHPKDWAEIVEEFNPEVNTDDNNLNYCFRMHAEDIKWYEGYKDIDLFTTFMNFMADKEDTSDKAPMAAVFIRIGEEDDDITADYVGDSYELAHVYSGIEED